MIDLVKVLVERVLSWPVAIFFLCLIFRKPIEHFLKRIILVKAPGVELSAPANAKEQLIEVGKSALRDPLAQVLPPQRAFSIPEDLGKKQLAVKTYGGDKPILVEQMGIITAQLNELQLPLDSAETAQILIRHLAVTQLLHRVEVTYRIIFGSQIEALQLLQNNGPQPEEVIRSFFDRARSRAPKFYGAYSFEEWSGFLIRQALVVFEENLFTISVYGGEFLAWLSATKVPKKLH